MKYEGHPFQGFGPISYSQWGEDLFILTLFKDLNIDHPSYLDVGAYHPFTISNTALMYLRGSKGINVEANPYNFELFAKHRPTDVNILKAVFPVVSNETRDYYIIDYGSPCNSLSLTELADNNLKHSEVLKVETTTLNEIIDEHANGNFPDFLNIDIEGLDYEVLKEADFVKSRPKIICAECREPEKIIKMMRDKDYKDLVRFAGNILFMDKAFV